MCFTWFDCKFFITFLGNSAICQAFFTSSDQKRSSYDSPWMSCSIAKRISDLINEEDGWYYTWWESVCLPLIPTDFSLHCTPASLNNKAYNKIQMIPSESTHRLINHSTSRCIDNLFISPHNIRKEIFQDSIPENQMVLRMPQEKPWLITYCLIELHKLTCLTCWCERSIKHWNISMS